MVLAIGTRPEAIKMAPVYHALRATRELDPVVLVTGQHREQLLPVLAFLRVPIARNLEVMTEKQELTDLAARILPGAARALRDLGASYLLVHGDTLSTFAVAWCAFLQGVCVGHVEAGLRSGSLQEPFPEEANRRLTDCITDLDLPPTVVSLENLLREGKSREHSVVTGQTGIDAIRLAARLGRMPNFVPANRKLVTITLHRRENWALLPCLAQALARVARRFPEFHFVYPVHLNPIVRQAVTAPLTGLANVILCEPLGYGEMAALLRRSELLITDSGGLQEEGAAFSIPVAVVRNVTERPEGVASGILRLVGNNPERVEAEVSRLLGNGRLRGKMQQSINPYGDGRASARVASAVAWRLGLRRRPANWNGRATAANAPARTR